MAASPITEEMVNAAQQAWCDGLMHIGAVDAEGGDVRDAATEFVDALYDYAEGTVFFKPTLAYGKSTFRSTKRGAISYFVGGDPDFPEDTGFALKRWVKVWYDNNAAENRIQIHGDIAITMGNLYPQNAAGARLWWTRPLCSVSAAMASCVFRPQVGSSLLAGSLTQPDIKAQGRSHAWLSCPLPR